MTQKKSLVAPPKRDLAVPLNAARNLAVFKKKNRAVPQHAALRKAPKKAPATNTLTPINNTITDMILLYLSKLN